MIRRPVPLPEPRWRATPGELEAEAARLRALIARTCR